MIRWKVMTGVVALLALTAACTSGGDDQPPPSTVTAVGRPSSVPFAAEGTDYRVVRDLPMTVAGRTVDYYAPTDRGPALAVQYASSDAPGAPPPSRLLSVDPDGGRTGVLHRATHKHMTSIVEVSRGDGFLTWLQSDASGYDSLNWDIYSRELATGTTRLIASSAELGIDDPPWPSFESIRPQIVGDHVYWAAVEKVLAGKPRSAIYRAPLDGARPMTKVIDNATDVYADGRDLWFQRDGSMLAWDVSTGKERSAPRAAPSSPCGGFFQDGTLVQVDCAGTGSLLITERSGKRTSLTGVDTPGYIGATSRWVGFSTDEQAYVYDLRRKHLMRLKGSNGYSARALKGDRLFYIRQRTDPSYLYIALLPE